MNYRKGSLVNPGYNIIDISAENEKYLVCYVPRKYSYKLSYGDKIPLLVNKKKIEAEIRFIDVKSQYTPRDLQTFTTRNKKSVQIKMLLPFDANLKPGDIIKVIIDK